MHVLVLKSKHEKGIDTEDLRYIFPKLGQLSWIKFIDSWKEYDAIKKTGTEILPSYDFDEIPILTGLKLAFTMNTVYKPLLKQYDMENGIFLHYRLGDKIKQINQYVIMKPSYFTDHAKKFFNEKRGPIYLLSDSPKIAHKLLPYAEVVDLDWVSTFYLMTKCKRGIFSESTFGVVAAFLNHEDNTIVYPSYYMDMDKKILVERSWGPVFTYEHNQNYRAKHI